MSENREICFVNPQNDEPFKIPDGGRIVVTRPKGEIYPNSQEQWIGDCRYLDSCHVSINGECFHIDQFYGIQKRIGGAVEPETAPEYIAGYRVTARTFVGDKVYKLGHNPKAVQPYGTWQGYSDPKRGNDWGHYWKDKRTAHTDFFLRADSERTGKSYDHTTLMKQDKGREDDGR